jgi:hypothetical protein
MKHDEAYTPTFRWCAVRTGSDKWNEHPFDKKLVTKHEIKQEYSELKSGAQLNNRIICIKTAGAVSGSTSFEQKNCSLRLTGHDRLPSFPIGPPGGPNHCI